MNTKILNIVWTALIVASTSATYTMTKAPMLVPVSVQGFVLGVDGEKCIADIKKQVGEKESIWPCRVDLVNGVPGWLCSPGFSPGVDAGKCLDDIGATVNRDGKHETLSCENKLVNVGKDQVLRQYCSYTGSQIKAASELTKGEAVTVVPR